MCVYYVKVSYLKVCPFKNLNVLKSEMCVQRFVCAYVSWGE